MRSSLARTAIVAATIMALSGCRSGASNSGWSWGWNRKNAAAGNPSSNNPSSGPQLPSASATPPGFTPGASATVQQGVANGYAVQASASGGAYPASSYPGQPAGYNNATAGPGGIPNSATPGANYGAMPNSATPNYGAPGNNPAPQNNLAPQNGAYSDTYGQAAGQAAGVPPSYGTPAGGYQNAGGPTSSYQAPSAQPPADPGQAQPAYPTTAADPNGNVLPPAAGNYGNPAPPAGGAYGAVADPNAAGGYPSADNRYTSGAAQPEQIAADRYAAPPSAASNDPIRTDGAASSGPPAAERYQPGNTGYTPGSTSYSPPGVPPYQMPAQPNVVSTGGRKDPYYRPGGTTDYVSGPAARVASSAGLDTPTTPPTDRYGVPATPAGVPVDQYSAPPAGPASGSYQPPANPNGGY